MMDQHDDSSHILNVFFHILITVWLDVLTWKKDNSVT